jgi:hypothetical protein
MAEETERACFGAFFSPQDLRNFSNCLAQKGYVVFTMLLMKMPLALKTFMLNFYVRCKR